MHDYKSLTNRAIQIMYHYDMSQLDFAQKIGIVPNRISLMKSGRKMAIDILLGIAQNFPNVSAEWLVRGEGEMLKSIEGDDVAMMREPSSPRYAVDKESISYLAESLMSLATKVGAIQREIEELKKSQK